MQSGFHCYKEWTIATDWRNNPLKENTRTAPTSGKPPTNSTLQQQKTKKENSYDAMDWKALQKNYTMKRDQHKLSQNIAAIVTPMSNNMNQQTLISLRLLDVETYTVSIFVCVNIKQLNNHEIGENDQNTLNPNITDVSIFCSRFILNESWMKTLTLCHVANCSSKVGTMWRKRTELCFVATHRDTQVQLFSLSIPSSTLTRRD